MSAGLPPIPPLPFAEKLRSSVLHQCAGTLGAGSIPGDYGPATKIVSPDTFRMDLTHGEMVAGQPVRTRYVVLVSVSVHEETVPDGS